MATDVKVPALGESITEGTLAQWLKKAGDAVAADEPIASLETDKVTVEVPSPAAGVLSETLVNEGDTVAVGALIARIDEGGAAAAPSAPATPAEKGAEATPTNPEGPAETPGLRGTDAAPEPAARARRAGPGRPGRPRHHLVARGAAGGARAPCRPDQHQGHRQGRPPDQGRRAGRGAGAEKRFPGAGRGPGAAGESAGISQQAADARLLGPGLRRGTPGSARKNASRCRGFGRPSPSG